MGAGLGLAGGVLQAGGQIAGGIMANNAAKANAQVALSEGNAEAANLQDKSRMQLGKVQQAYASGGVVANTGTPLRVMGQTALSGELARQLAIYRGEISAEGDKYQGKAAEDAGIVGGAGTILTSLAKFGSTQFPGTFASMAGGG